MFIKNNTEYDSYIFITICNITLSDDNYTEEKNTLVGIMIIIVIVLFCCCLCLCNCKIG